jgi:hypothetical protein
MDTFTSVVVVGLTAFLAPDMPAPRMPVHMYFLPAEQMVHRCGPMRLGCSVITSKLCEVWVLSDILYPDQRLEIIRHELAHCSGWGHE